MLMTSVQTTYNRPFIRWLLSILNRLLSCYIVCDGPVMDQFVLEYDVNCKFCKYVSYIF